MDLFHNSWVFAHGLGRSVFLAAWMKQSFECVSPSGARFVCTVHVSVCTHSLVCDVKMECTVSLFISTDSCFCLRATVVFQLRWQNNRQQFKDKMVMDECSFCLDFDVFTSDILVVILLCSTSVFYMLCPDSLSYLYSPQLLLAGRSGAERFGRDQAKGGQTESLCVYIEEQETVRGGDGVASTDRAQWGNGGGLPKKKKKNTIATCKDASGS